ncbi:DNA primase [Patescibacteria group bacterium]
MAQTDSELVKSKTDIVDVITSRVSLKKAGKHFKSPCPFHAENDPSFVVSPELQIYKCFGCGRSGDVFTFLQEYEGMDFVESLEYLAEKVNVTLTKRPGSQGQKKKLIEIHESVNNFYKYILSSHPLGRKAREYLGTRGINDATIQTFDIGYSPINQEPYCRYLTGKKRYTTKLLDRAGLAYSYYGKPKDRFSGRITFPLTDHRGIVLGFAGRVLPENDTGKMGKYINSPETEIYHKSKMLYGLNLAKDAIRRKNTAILVEGELDMISSFQAGIRNTVAIKGSALTTEQTLLLKRFADRIVFALDADFAGNAAARRGIEVAEDSGLEVKVAALGKYKDPDEAVRGNLSEYKEILKSSKNVWDFLIDTVFDNYNKETGSGKQKISREVVPILASIKDSIVRSHYVEIVANRLQINQEAVLDQLNKTSRGSETKDASTEETPPKASRRELLEERFLSLSFQFDLGSMNSKSASLIKSRKFANLVEEFLVYKKTRKNPNLKEFSSTLSKHLVSTFESLIMTQNDISSSEAKKELKIVRKELEIIAIREQMGDLAKAIKEHESKGNKSNLAKSQKNLAKLKKKLADFSN